MRVAGVTLTEVLTASMMTVLVLFGATLVFLSGAGSWARGQNQMDVESQSQRTMRILTAQLREAMAVTVAGDGTWVDYRLPQKDANGEYIVPAVWDGIARRLELTAQNRIRLVAGGTTRFLADNVIGTDPNSAGGTGTYKIFTAGAGAITRQVNAMLVLRYGTVGRNQSTARIRETVFLRNVPALTK